MAAFVSSCQSLEFFFLHSTLVTRRPPLIDRCNCRAGLRPNCSIPPSPDVVVGLTSFTCRSPLSFSFKLLFVSYCFQFLPGVHQTLCSSTLSIACSLQPAAPFTCLSCCEPRQGLGFCWGQSVGPPLSATVYRRRRPRRGNSIIVGPLRWPSWPPWLLVLGHLPLALASASFSP
jgi:hypothetical protein